MDEERSVLDRALDAAVELVVEQIPPLPPLPSSATVRSEFGLGVSSFYRLFGSTENYREHLIEHLLAVPYLEAEGPLLDALEQLSDELSQGVEVDNVDSILFASTSFDAARPHSLAPEADWLPWLENEVVRRWLRGSLKRAFEAELQPIENVVGRGGLRFVGVEGGADFLIRQIALTIGSGVCGNDDAEWNDGTQVLPLRLAARWRLGLMLLEDREGTANDER